MQISKRKINSRIEKQIFDLFYQLLADIRSPQEAKTFLENLLTKTELTALVKRLAVAHYLEKGRTYDNIKKTLGVSSTTVATVQEQMAKGQGFALALKKVQAEEWADSWADKIAKMMKISRK